MIDQAAHFLIGTVAAAGIVGAYLLFGGEVAGALAGLLLGMMREVTHMQTVGDNSFGKNRIVDVVFWTLGGAFGGAWL